MTAKTDTKKLKTIAQGTNDNGSKEERLDLIAELGGGYFSTPQGLAFYFGNNAPPIEIESPQFEGLMSEIKYNRLGRPANGEEILAVRRLTRYYASKNVREVGVRVARMDDAIIYDPVCDDGKIFKINSDGIVLTALEKPATVRFVGMLRADVMDGTREDYLSLIDTWRMDDNTKLLSIGLDFSRFIPGIPHAIEVVTGDHGAGKTSYTVAKRELIDPNGAPTQALKFDERDISISALHQGILAFDNVNTTMPDYISDVICRISTGQGFRTRELYSNTSEVILKLKKPILMNGINIPGYKPDFLDRSVPILLRPIFGEGRLSESEIKQRVENLLPSARGYLLSVVPKAIQLYSEVEKELMGKLPRMADFVIWAECGLRAMGFPSGAFFNAYQQVKKRETEDLAKENTLIIAIQELMSDREEWRGTSSELLDNLNPYITENKRRFDSKLLPKDPKRLGRLIKEHELVLRELGYEVATLTDGNRTKVIRRIGLVDKVNVSDVRTEPDITKFGLPGADINKNTTLEKISNVSEVGLVKIGFQSKSDNTDIRNMYEAYEEDRKKSGEHAPDIVNSAFTSEDSGQMSITKEQGDESVRMVLKQGVHLNAADTGVSIYGDKFNIAVIGAYYRQNTETVNRIMEDLGFTKGNTGSLGNVFFSRPLKGGDQK